MVVWRILFVIFALIINIFMAMFIYKNFFQKFDFFHRRGVSKLVKPFCIFLGSSIIGYALFARLYYNYYAAYFFSAVFGIEALLFILALFRLIVKSVPIRFRFSKEVSKTLQLSYLLFSGVTVIAAFTTVAVGPELKEVSIKIDNFPVSDYKIAQLSDVHIGPTIKKDAVSKIVEMTNASNPDLIVITGDLIDLKVSLAKNDLLPLSELKAKDGVYFVVGNHEYLANDFEALFKFLKKIGIVALNNDKAVIETSGGPYNLLGITDKQGNRFDMLKPKLMETISLVKPEEPTILLSHRPLKLKQLGGQVDLVLAGHTHGGQIFPFDLLVLLTTKYLQGLYHEDGTYQYVSVGTGYWGPMIRLFDRSEVTLIKISSK